MLYKREELISEQFEHLKISFRECADVLLIEIFISSEGALYVIMPYDYPAQQRTHFLNTHRSLITTLSINAMMTLLTMISMMTKITKIT